MTAKIIFLAILEHWYVLLVLWIGFVWLILTFMRGESIGRDDNDKIYRDEADKVLHDEQPGSIAPDRHLPAMDRPDPGTAGDMVAVQAKRDH